MAHIAMGIDHPSTLKGGKPKDKLVFITRKMDNSVNLCRTQRAKCILLETMLEKLHEALGIQNTQLKQHPHHTITIGQCHVTMVNDIRNTQRNSFHSIRIGLETLKVRQKNVISTRTINRL